MRDPFSQAATGVLVVCAVLVTGSVLHRELRPAPAGARAPDLSTRRVANWPELSAGANWLGRRDAPVRIVEFSDLQCPFCARTHPLLEALQQRQPQRVAVLYRHFPLDAIHPLARTAALAVECAAAQGAFAALTRVLFAQQDSLGRVPWRSFAQQAAVPDLAGFERCLATRRFAGRVARDVAAGERARIEVTPTLIINGVLHPGAVTAAQLDSLVRAAAP